MSNQNSQQVLVSYPSDDSDTPINVVVRDDTIWATQKAISELFDVGKSAISKHLKNIFETNELEENRVVSILETTAPDGKIYKTNHYNLDAIISLGYRINSKKATALRQYSLLIFHRFR